uniref:Uncharacterized protein n=1 Tax=Anguilla anguilla TaxID=7936 RepID=A0A0E9V7B4_ANGAN
MNPLLALPHRLDFTWSRKNSFTSISTNNLRSK